MSTQSGVSTDAVGGFPRKIADRRVTTPVTSGVSAECTHEQSTPRPEVVLCDPSLDPASRGLYLTFCCGCD